MPEKVANQGAETSPKHVVGILYDRQPKVGVVVQGYDVDELLTHPHVQETEVAAYQRELGVNRAVSFKPGMKDQFHWEYSEYMNFDNQNRPIATNKHQGGIFYTRLFEYDQLGRLIKLTDNSGFIHTNTQEFSYSSEIPGEDGQFPFVVHQSNESHLRTT